MGKLTNNQEGFSVDYVLHGNATMAYRDNYKTASMKDKTINEEASRLLKNPKVAARVAELEGKKKKIAEEEFEIDAKYILSRHKQIDQLDIFEILTDDLQKLRPLSEWPKAWRISLNGFDISEVYKYIDGSNDIIGFLKKIKLPDKLKNLELMGKHASVGAYKEQSHHTHDISDDLKALADRLPD